MRPSHPCLQRGDLPPRLLQLALELIALGHNRLVLPWRGAAEAGLHIAALRGVQGGAGMGQASGRVWACGEQGQGSVRLLALEYV
jgi:hypothetical protein